jgi:hypothetical protein
MYAARFGDLPFSDDERSTFARWLEQLARPPENDGDRKGG